MIEMKKIFIGLFVFIFIHIEQVSSKSLPPGTGAGDVPANILIMLDKSGSMGWRMSGGTASMRYPYDADADSNGDIIVSQYNRDGVKKFVYGSSTLDTGFGTNGVTGKSGNCKTSYSYSGEVYNDVYYTTAYYEQAVVAIRASDGACLRKYDIGGYPYNMTIDQSTGTLYVGHSGGLKKINLSNNQMTNCSVISQLRYSYGTKISGGYIYAHYRNRMYRNAVSNSNCPSSSWTSFSYSKGSYLGLEANPNNSNELWTLSWSNSKMEKITVNGSGNGYTLNKTIGSRSTSTSTSSKTYFYYPWGLGWDQTNNRLIAANHNGGDVQIFDTNGTWIKTIGGLPSTRMQAAAAAIKSLVTDASLTSGVDYGFAYWASGSAGFSRWNGNHKTGSGSATPCSSYNCLKVPIQKSGAAQIAKMIDTVSPGGGTDADAFMKIAQQYFLNSTYTPIDSNSLDCQKSYVVVIGDGDWYNHSGAVAKASSLFQVHGIRTYTVAFGTGISASGLRNFNALAVAGGTTKAIVATTGESLKSQLKAAISQIIANKLSFTAPAITATVDAGGSVYQAKFNYEQNKEWTGTLTSTKINADGTFDDPPVVNWDTANVLDSPSSRKIWSVIPGTDYAAENYNNFNQNNAVAIGNVMAIYGNDILDYHRDTNNSDGSTNNRRCATTSGVIDGVTDDQIGLINFIRGTDYFDYDADCNLTETRKSSTGTNVHMGDIYHSQLVVVGAPSAETSYVSINQESYFRSIKGYDAWAQSLENRKEIVYAGSNSGILHAFDAKTGEEEWGFIPPLISPKLPLVMNTLLNQPTKGGSNAVFGVDGSLVVHDMYFKSPLDTAKKWHTMLFVPYGRGGNGFSVLDITDPIRPLHLYSMYNDSINNKVYRVDHNQNIYVYDYIARSYSLASFNESITVTDKYNNNNSVSNTCNNSLNTSCYKGRTWTFPVQGVSKSDLNVIYNGSTYTNFSLSTNSSGDTVITFGTDITYSADPGDTNISSQIGVYIKPNSQQTGVKTDPQYDYSLLGETWSDPRIFRIPNRGAGDTNIEDDIYVAAMGGGMGAQYEGVGSNLTIINLEDNTNPGALLKVIEIEDTDTSDIVNSTPAASVLITPDTARGINFTGALLYLNDLEGKITKFNLTNMSDDGNGNAIKLYDSTTLFTAGSTSANGRYMYHAMDATIGDSTNTFWLFAGTGDYERINDTTTGVENYLLGIKDSDFPLYKEVATPANADDITNCKNTTNDKTGASCPENADKGWYVSLSDFKKVTAEPTVHRGVVYFPLFKPTTGLNKCAVGAALICAVDDECGTDLNAKIGGGGSQSITFQDTGTTVSTTDDCKFVGMGVLSKIVTFADKLFANIAGKSGGKITEFVNIEAAVGGVSTYRNSWRQNY